ncbi:MAG: DNA-binding response regulator [Crocinitomicaceae bacterium]|nr:DNA-binding response regulator [Crocinitomicaceae bacterium]|tara:strand:- start:24170 stop:24853 length:684 start_codon:yes stop_codon:yes gene_type:complete
MVSERQILLVEDDQNLAYLIREQLNEYRFKTVVCTTGLSGLEAFKERLFDLCIFDIQLPDFDGYRLAQKVKKIDQKIPLIFLTSRNLKKDQLRGYSLGADDYVTKPFDFDLLFVKIKAILQRSHTGSAAITQSVTVRNYTVNSVTKVFTTPNGDLNLSNTEIGILFLFFTEFEQPISRERVMKEVWGRSDYYISKSLDVYINRIRKVLKKETNLTLKTIHSFGFMLE